MHACYEAGPCGFGIARRLRQLGIDCMAVAPTPPPLARRRPSHVDPVKGRQVPHHAAIDYRRRKRGFVGSCFYIRSWRLCDWFSSPRLGVVKPG